MSAGSILPNEVHTSRELEFMLHRGKPLAVFVDEYPADPCEEIIPEQAFAPHVADGTLVAREFVELLSKPAPPERPALKGFRRVLYATPHEDWRIDAYIDLHLVRGTSGWSVDLEREEGLLLGYEQWQNDIWIEHIRTTEPTCRCYWLKNAAPVAGS